MSALESTGSALALPGISRLVGARLDDVVAPRASAALLSRQQWEHRFRVRLRISDTVVVVLACAIATTLTLLVGSTAAGGTGFWAVVASGVLAVVLWLVMMSLLGTRSPAIMGIGPTEYSRVAHATGLAFGALAVCDVLFDLLGMRLLVLVALPVGAAMLILTRRASRKWLVAQRRAGRYASRTIVVGARDDVEYAIRALSPRSGVGYHVVGTSLIDDSVDRLVVDDVVYPTSRGMASVRHAAEALRADTILVTSQPVGDPGYIKRLAWEVEGSAAELVLSNRIADVAGPRMSLSAVEGMPLLHVAIPTFDGGSYAVKRTLDVLTAATALLLFAPVALLIALAIRIDDPGPVFFHQARVGRDGRQFRMIKFRSMCVNAEAELAALAADNEGAGPLFKLKSDPRVTRVGRILRKYSLDEVPQFWNVLRGDMSVVGPRPPLPAEVTSYEGTVHRRLYIKPGITGPWQVGGRSDLSWDESVRLDLRYVENWSVMSDIVLMWRTAKVMVRPDGAY